MLRPASHHYRMAGLLANINSRQLLLAAVIIIAIATLSQIAQYTCHLSGTWPKIILPNHGRLGRDPESASAETRLDVLGEAAPLQHCLCSTQLRLENAARLSIGCTIRRRLPSCSRFGRALSSVRAYNWRAPHFSTGVASWSQASALLPLLALASYGLSDATIPVCLSATCCFFLM